jgi:hypothetical protein
MPPRPQGVVVNSTYRILRIFLTSGFSDDTDAFI